MPLTYRKIFDPETVQKFHAGPLDSLTESTYVYTDEIVLAVNVALATGRPLLVRGASGCGKSTLARNVAKVLGYRYYEHVVSSRTQARDLLWQVDLLRRLQDAQAKTLAADFSPYVIPGVLWWAFDRESALAQAARQMTAKLHEPGEDTPGEQAVVLLDEIDKADPDVPNNLLVPLGSLNFVVEDTGEPVKARTAPLIFLTTNDERDLPPAFVRRCVELKIGSPATEQLIAAGRAHFPGGGLDGAITEVARQLEGSRAQGGPAPSTAEYLDTLRACQELGVTPDSPMFQALLRVTVWKHGRTAAP